MWVLMHVQMQTLGSSAAIQALTCVRSSLRILGLLQAIQGPPLSSTSSSLDQEQDADMDAGHR